MVLTSSTTVPQVEDIQQTVFVLFGSTGDLAQRKLLPALCALFQKKLLPQGLKVFAYSRRHWGSEEYREFIRPALVAFPAEVVEQFLQTVQHIEGVFDIGAGFEKLKEKIGSADALFYLAVQPELCAPIIEQLGNAGLQGKLLIEKPFGRDLASAQELEHIAEQYFLPEQIFRVDHYLGKDGLAAMRVYIQAHPEFAARLNHEYVATVAVRIFETIGVEGRGAFYDSVGALRDVGQSHLLQMLGTLVPIASLAPPAEVVRGQYQGYVDEPNVRVASQAETYFNITTQSTDPRWCGVPILLEAGKALAQKKNEIEINFKDGSHLPAQAGKVFPMDPDSVDRGHQTIIEAALRGDQSFFVSLDEVLASWRFVGGVRERFATVPLTIYTKGASKV